MAHLKTLNVRYRICDNCCKANFVVDAGERKRFCQQCSRLQPIEEFDGSKRSCRDRLRRIGERRKDKMQLEEVSIPQKCICNGMTAKHSFSQSGCFQGHNKTRDVPVSSSWEHTSSLDAAQAIHEGSLQQDELSPLGRNTGAPSSMDVLISCQDSVSGVAPCQIAARPFCFTVVHRSLKFASVGLQATATFRHFCQTLTADLKQSNNPNYSISCLKCRKV